MLGLTVLSCPQQQGWIGIVASLEHVRMVLSAQISQLKMSSKGTIHTKKTQEGQQTGKHPANHWQPLLADFWPVSARIPSDTRPAWFRDQHSQAPFLTGNLDVATLFWGKVSKLKCMHTS